MDIDSEPISSPSEMANLDEDLMERLRSITTSNREDLIAQFRSTTNAMLTDAGCTFFLEMNNWNLNEAILAYYDAEMPTDKLPQMRFLADVTVGEGEAIPPKTRFVKTWRIENSGSEPWPNNCSLRFVNGDRLQDRDEVYVSSLAPGEQINVSVDITSPNVTQIIRSQWRLFTPAGVPFGDPIWLIASVEEGGLMGITQQLEQCHSLGMNVNPFGTNPFQANRWPHADTHHGTNFPVVPVPEYSRTSNITQTNSDSSTSSNNNAMADDNSLDTF